ncbi:MAG: acetyl-CoA carboxylase biotin carboxyl carrier protein subunit, partial [Comamonas sp.]
LTASLVRWHRADGEQVRAGEVIATLEAMKMETAVLAPCAGRLTPLARAGELLQTGQLLAKIDVGA